MERTLLQYPVVLSITLFLLDYWSIARSEFLCSVILVAKPLGCELHHFGRNVSRIRDALQLTSSGVE